MCACSSPLQCAFPQYQFPHALADYAELADLLKLGGNSNEEKVVRLIGAIEDLKKAVDIPLTLKEVIGSEEREEYMVREGGGRGLQQKQWKQRVSHGSQNQPEGMRC